MCNFVNVGRSIPLPLLLHVTYIWLLHYALSLPLQVLNQAVEVSAQGGTTPAASLWPFYQKKEEVKTFIMVTDEEENGRVQNMWYGYNVKLFFNFFGQWGRENSK